MLTEEDKLPVVSKKKIDKGQSSGDVSTSPDKGENKKSEKNDGEDPKPRIVLTFRSDKKNCNMKIVPNDEKHEEISPRRSTRRSKWEWSEEAETSISPKKDKNSSLSVSETDETSDSSQTTTKRLTRRRSKDSSDNVLANAIAMKEKSMNEAASGPTQRLSRRIKPTAKILANEELRIGLESQNNARLGIQNEKPEEGVRTRRTRSMQPEVGSTQVSKKETRNSKVIDEVEDAEKRPEEPNENTVMKLKHLCELGLKAINSETLEDEPEDMEEDEEDEEAEIEDDDDDLEEEEEEDDEEDDDEIDDDSEVISKLLEADEDSSVEFNCAVESSQSRRPRRSTRLHSSFGVHDNDSPIPVDDEQKETLRRSRRSARFDESLLDADLVNLCDGEYRPPRKRNRERHEEVTAEEEKDEGNNRERRSRRLKEDKRSKWLPETHDVKADSADENSEPAGGEEGSEAACPEDESAVVATCYCETPSNVHAAPEDVPEPVFCQAIELVDGVRVGCSHQARRADDGALAALLRAGPRAPFVLLCALHAAQLHRHMCCPTCGLFCTQGIFYQCSEGHLFHLECGLPYNDVKQKPGCPHCGVRSYRWQPHNKLCSRVQLAMRCSNKRIFLPDQREQCTPAYLGFTRLEESQIDQTPVIPEDLLPSPPIDLKRLCQESEQADHPLLASTPAQRLCDAILAGDTLEQLLPKIVSRACVNTALTSLSGGTSVHAACSRARADALYALQYAGGDLDAPDNALRTPLILALQTLFDKPDKKSQTKNRNINEKDSKDEESKEVEQNGDKDEKEEIDDDSLIIKRDDSVKDEDLIKVIRYLVAAGCDVNIQGAEGMRALHMAAQHGSAPVCQILLDANAEVDARDLGGWTPLVWAAENAHNDVVRLLLSHGAQADTVDAEGNSALHWCALAGHAPATSLLLAAAPAARDRPNAHRDTPLHVAARQGHYACVVILLAQGARTDIENSAGSLPVEVCDGPSQSAISLNMQMKLLVKGAAVRHQLLSSDISNGTEMFPVPCINEVDDAPLPADFTYVADHVMPEPLDIDNTIQSMQGCSCKDGDCSEAACACGVLSVRRWLTARGRLPPDFPHHDPPMLFECNATCSCNKRKCGNMVISRLKARGSLFTRAVVFRTPSAGWGLRAAAHAARGAAVALYCGELLALPAADARPNDQYLFALDVKPDLLQQCNDKTLLCVDACLWGSAARFINHSCRPNLAPVRVFSSTRDLRLPSVTLFAIKDIRPGDELTFDYGDKFWSVKSKWMKCECGTPECRYPNKSTDSDN